MQLYLQILTKKILVIGKVKLLVESQNFSGSSIHLKSKYWLMISNYGIKAPEPMMGLVKVHDKIVIHFDLILSMAF